MKFPKLKKTPQTMKSITVFGGYRHTPRIGDGEFYDMENLTSEQFPLLAPRAGRQHIPTEGATEALAVNNGLCRLWLLARSTVGKMGSYRLDLPEGLTLELELPANKKKLVNMGGYLLVFPDKLWVNVPAAMEAGTVDGSWGRMEAHYRAEEVRFQVCTQEGEPLDFSAAREKPSDPADGAYWLDTENKTPVMKRWYDDAGLWMEETCYLRLRLTREDGAELFREGDALTGPAVKALRVMTPEGEERETLVYIPKDPVIQRVMEEPEEGCYGVVIPGIADWGTAEGFSVAAADLCWDRTVPDMQFVTESGNRLWGCRYGMNREGFVNEIYASKLGDFRNWHSFRGISTDSYVMSVGTDGPFTGAVSYLGRPVFFKETCAMQIFGDRPATFRLQSIPCQGIQPGCDASAAILGGVLYYRSRSGVCAFDGATSVEVGQALGRCSCSKAVGGALGDRYYLAMERQDGWELFVYDAAKGLWHREDRQQVLQMLTWEDRLYAVTGEKTGYRILRGATEPNEGPVSWMAQTGPMGLTTPERKYVSRIHLRLWLEVGSTLRVLVRYDKDPGWEQLHTLTGTHTQVVTLPIRTKRCHQMELRLEGRGDAKIYGLFQVWEEGSDVP